MKQRDWFAVGVRLFGVWLLLDCVEEIRAIAEILFRFFTPERTPLAVYVIHGIVSFVLGLYLIGGAPLLVNIAFPRRKETACKSCGYDLTGNTTGICPECGAVVVPSGSEK